MVYIFDCIEFKENHNQRILNPNYERQVVVIKWFMLTVVYT